MIDLIEKYLKLLKDALSALYHDEAEVVAINANERCMAAIVFACMKEKMAAVESLKQYKIDYEYNREGPNGVPKELFVKYVEDKEKKNHLIIPDLTIHKRQKNSCGDNLLLVEFKKTDVPYKDDIAKLEEMTKQDTDGKFRYKAGLLVVFGTLLSETKFKVYVNGTCLACNEYSFDQFDLLLAATRTRLKELFPVSSV